MLSEFDLLLSLVGDLGYFSFLSFCIVGWSVFMHLKAKLFSVLAGLLAAMLFVPFDSYFHF